MRNKETVGIPTVSLCCHSFQGEDAERLPLGNPGQTEDAYEQYMTGLSAGLDGSVNDASSGGSENSDLYAFLRGIAPKAYKQDVFACRMEVVSLFSEAKYTLKDYLRAKQSIFDRGTMTKMSV